MGITAAMVQKKKGIADGVIRQLTVRFGALDESTVSSIRNASLLQLEWLTDRALAAPSLDAAFAPPFEEGARDEPGPRDWDRLAAVLDQLGPDAVEVRERAQNVFKDQGRAMMLLRQLERRFGWVEDRLAERVRSATTEQLEVLTDRVLSAPTLRAALDDWDVVGQSRILLRQLRFRFGPIDDDTVRRLRSSSGERLDMLAERVLTAATFADVFVEGEGTN